jgi:tRNA threonylcarbamoyladenosine biosynthesis protein TsaE
MRKQLKAETIADLDQIAVQLTPLVKRHKKVAFIGEIGAGKTTFIKALCLKMGVEGNTASPTYSIINEYSCGDETVHHIDLYRLKSKEEVHSLGLMELFDGNSYCFVEWPGIAEDYFPEQTIWIKISTGEKEERIFDIFYIE